MPLESGRESIGRPSAARQAGGDEDDGDGSKRRRDACDQDAEASGRCHAHEQVGSPASAGGGNRW